MTTIILIIFCVAVVGVVATYLVALTVAAQNIFANSGSPINMANMILQSILAVGQILVGLAILAVMALLIVAGYISSEVGLPIIASIAGYLVGRSFEGKVIK